MTKAKKLLSYADIAARFNISRTSVRRLIDIMHIARAKKGANRTWLFDDSILGRFDAKYNENNTYIPQKEAIGILNLNWADFDALRSSGAFSMHKIGGMNRYIKEEILKCREQLPDILKGIDRKRKAEEKAPEAQPEAQNDAEGQHWVDFMLSSVEIDMIGVLIDRDIIESIGKKNYDNAVAYLDINRKLSFLKEITLNMEKNMA